MRKAKRVSNGKVRYGVVGVGAIAQSAFLPGLLNTNNSEVTALVTGDPAKIAPLREKYGDLAVYGYDGFDELFDADVVDAIYVASPNHLHLDHALPALRAGVHVLLEKPMAVSEDQCRTLIAAAEESEAKLMIAYRLHFEPATVAAIEQVRDGDIGEPRGFAATFCMPLDPENHRAKHGFDDGPVYDLGVYPLNAVRQYFGTEPVEVSAVASRNPDWGLDLDDTVSVTLRFPNGGLATFIVSYAMESHDRYSVVGTKGSVAFQPGFGYESGLEYALKTGAETDHRKYLATDQFAGEIQYFSRCVIEGLDPEPDGEEGWCDVRVVEAVRRCLETGRAQRLKPHTRARRVEPDQAAGLPPAPEVSMVHASNPSRDD